MEIKTIIRCYLTPVRMAIINKSKNSNCCQDYGEKEPSLLLVGMQTGTSTVESSMEFPQKNKNRTALRPSSTSGNISKETENTNTKEYTHPYVHCSIIYKSQNLEAVQVPAGREVDEKAVVHLHNGN